MNDTKINQGTYFAHAVINNRGKNLNGSRLGMGNHEGICNLTYESLKYTLNIVEIGYNHCNCCVETFYVLFLPVDLHR